VETYKGLGYKTGMTGDGVSQGVAPPLPRASEQRPGANDAPALKAADVGPRVRAPPSLSVTRGLLYLLHILYTLYILYIHYITLYYIRLYLG